MQQLEDDSSEKTRICKEYPFLAYWSPVKIPWREHFRKATYNPLKPLIRPVLKYLRETPRVFVSMPFDYSEPTLAFHFVVRPLVEQVFGGTCARYKKPGATDSEWKQNVMMRMLNSHVIIFDRSYPNVNVYYETQWYEMVAETTRAKRRLRSICIFHRQFDQYIRPEPYCIPYACNQWWLRDFADDLREAITNSLLEMGFTKGKFDPWVLYPQEGSSLGSEFTYEIPPRDRRL